jgi:hypothetical protein
MQRGTVDAEWYAAKNAVTCSRRATKVELTRFGLLLTCVALPNRPASQRVLASKEQRIPMPHDPTPLSKPPARRGRAREGRRRPQHAELNRQSTEEHRIPAESGRTRPNNSGSLRRRLARSATSIVRRSRRSGTNASFCESPARPRGGAERSQNGRRSRTARGDRTRACDGRRDAGDARADDRGRGDAPNTSRRASLRSRPMPTKRRHPARGCAEAMLDSIGDAVLSTTSRAMSRISIWPPRR